MSIVRTYWTWKLHESPDVTWNISYMVLWTWAEMSTGILVSCLPTFPKLFEFVKKELYPALLRRFRSRSRDGELSTPTELPRRVETSLSAYWPLRLDVESGDAEK